MLPESERLVFQAPTSDWKLSGQSGLLFEKELIYEGDFQTDEAQFSVDVETLDHWHDMFYMMLENGVKVPLPVEHTEDPEANRGEIVGMTRRLNDNGKQSLFAKVKFRDKEAAELAKTANVSIMSPPEFVDGTGHRYVRPIRHVAITDYPVIPGLQGFKAIAASFVEGNSMPDVIQVPVEEIKEALGIEASMETPEEVKEAIIAAFQQQSEMLKEKEAALSELEEKMKASNGDGTGEPKKEDDPLVVTAAHKSMLRDNRTMKLDRLVNDGKLSPAARRELEDTYCSDKQLEIVLSQRNGDDSFDKVLAALEKNETVSLSESSGMQGGAALSKRGGPADNPLLADAEKRAKAASK